MGFNVGPPPRRRRPGLEDIRELKSRLGIEDAPREISAEELRRRFDAGEPPPGWGTPPRSSIKASGGSRIENVSVQGDASVVATQKSHISDIELHHARILRPLWKHPAVIAATISALGTVLAALIYVLWG